MDDFDLSDSYDQYSAQDAVQPNAPAIEAAQRMRAAQLSQATGIQPQPAPGGFQTTNYGNLGDLGKSGFSGGAFAIEVPWSQSDKIQKERLQKGLSSAQNEVESGIIEPAEGEQHKQAIMQALGPLLQREQKAQAQAKQQQDQELMHAMAMQHVIEQAHARSRARDFASTTGVKTDAVTGASEHFYPETEKTWKPIPFNRSEAAKERAASNQGEGGDYFPLGGGPGLAVAQPREWEENQQTVDAYNSADASTKRSMARFGYVQDALAEAKRRGYPGTSQSYQRTPEGKIDYSKPPIPTPPAAPPTQGTPTAATTTPPQADQFSQGTGDEAMGGGPAANPDQASAPDTRHHMTIINGTHKQVFAFNPNGTVETISDTRPPGTGVDDSQANALLIRARSEATQLMGPRPQVFGNNPRMMALQAQRQRTWDTNAGYIYRNAVLHQTKQADMEAQWANRNAYQAQGQQGKEELLQARGQQSMDLAAHRGATTSKILEDALKHAKALAGEGPITQEAIDKSVKYVRGLHAAHGAILPAGAPETPAPIPGGDLGSQFLQNLNK
jgi:hypothetical protein